MAALSTTHHQVQTNCVICCLTIKARRGRARIVHQDGFIVIELRMQRYNIQGGNIMFT